MVTRFAPEEKTLISRAPKGGFRIPNLASISQNGFWIGKDVSLGTLSRAVARAVMRNIRRASSGLTGLDRNGLVGPLFWFLLAALVLPSAFCFTCFVRFARDPIPASPADRFDIWYLMNVLYCCLYNTDQSLVSISNINTVLVFN